VGAAGAAAAGAREAEEEEEAAATKEDEVAGSTTDAMAAAVDAAVNAAAPDRRSPSGILMLDRALLPLPAADAGDDPPPFIPVVAVALCDGAAAIVLAGASASFLSRPNRRARKSIALCSLAKRKDRRCRRRETPVEGIETTE